MGPVFSELLDFERRLEEGKQEQKKKEEESNQKQSDGGEDFVFDFKTEKRPKIMSEESVLGKELASRERVNGEQKLDDSAIGEEEEEREGEEGEVKEYPSLHDLSSKVTAFTPSELDGFHGRSQLLRDKMTNFCAAKLWTSSGLTTLNGNQSLSALMMLSDSQSTHAHHLLTSLQALTTPWIQNGGENRLDRVFGEVMRLKTLGRFFFATFLSHIRDQVRRNPGEWRKGQSLLEKEIQRWKPLPPSLETKVVGKEEVLERRVGGNWEKLERRFLLKEMRIGRRCVHLPTWSGHVSTRIRKEELTHVHEAATARTRTKAEEEGTPMHVEMKMSPSEEEEDEKPRKKQYPKGMCDRCDGPHLTDACPIYKEKRNTFAKRNPAVKPGNSSVGLSVGGFTRSSDFVRTGEGWAKGAKGVGAKGVGVRSGSDGFSSRALAEIHERSHQRSVPEPCRKQSSYSSSSSEGSDSEWKPEKKKSGGSGRSNTRETAAPRGGAYICTYIYMYGDIHAYIHIYEYTCIHIHIYTYICMHIHHK
jgi:hypothetical protein